MLSREIVDAYTAILKEELIPAAGHLMHGVVKE